MKLGMPTLFEYNSILENISLAKKLNLDFIELNCNYDYVRSEIENEHSNLIDVLNENELVTTLHFYDDFDFFAPIEVVKAYISLFEKLVSSASDLNLKIVTVHLAPGAHTTINGVKKYNIEKDYKKALKRISEVSVKLEAICNKYKVQLAFENTIMPKPLQRIYNALAKDGFNFTYDVGHDYMDKERTLSLTKKLPNFVEFHIHDANKKSDHLVIGEGKVFVKPFKDLALALNSYVLIEVKDSESLIKSVSNFIEL